MIKKIMQKVSIYLLVVSTVFTLVGCKKEEPVENEVKKPKVKKEKVVGKLTEYQEKNIDFALNLLKNNNVINQNTVLSPISTQIAIATVLNGATSHTQGKLLRALKMELVTFNEYLKYYQEEIPNDVNCNINFSNSLWVNNVTGNLDINPNYKSRIQEYLFTEVQLLTFNTATKDILNNWIGKKTNNFIESLYIASSAQDQMYTVNVAGFDMEWEKAYSSNNIVEGSFRNINGRIAKVEMMTSEESLYIEGKNVKGFIKNFCLPRFQYVAIVPDNTMTLNQYLATVTAKDIVTLLTAAKTEKVKATMPKYTAIRTMNLQQALTKMGFDELYSPKSVYYGIMKNGNNVKLSKTYHKAKVEIGKNSTKVNGISTVNNVKTETANKSVVLNKPFLYMIYDSEQNVPLFIGIQQIM